MRHHTTNRYAPTTLQLVLLLKVSAYVSLFLYSNTYLHDYFFTGFFKQRGSFPSRDEYFTAEESNITVFNMRGLDMSFTQNEFEFVFLYISPHRDDIRRSGSLAVLMDDQQYCLRSHEIVHAVDERPSFLLSFFLALQVN